MKTEKIHIYSNIDKKKEVHIEGGIVKSTYQKRYQQIYMGGI